MFYWVVGVVQKTAGPATPGVISAHVLENQDISPGKGSDGPACGAGPSDWCLRCLRVVVLPRICGECSATINAQLCKHGPSPRLRGTHCCSRDHLHARRFIPASAGNTILTAPSTRVSTVHPRDCGEHMSLRGAKLFHLGSSPRLRGTLRGDVEMRVVRRLIPAPAGNTNSYFSRPSCETVHPRTCGEHLRAPFRTWTAPGSSPRLRGTLPLYT